MKIIYYTHSCMYSASCNRSYAINSVPPSPTLANVTDLLLLRICVFFTGHCSRWPYCYPHWNPGTCLHDQPAGKVPQILFTAWLVESQDPRPACYKLSKGQSCTSVFFWQHVQGQLGSWQLEFSKFLSISCCCAHPSLNPSSFFFHSVLQNFHRSRHILYTYISISSTT